MANKKFQSNNRRSRKRFLAVDIWQKEFGPVSVRAVYDVYSQKFNIPLQEVMAIDPATRQAKYSFSMCVNALRKLEDPTYVTPDE